MLKKITKMGLGKQILIGIVIGLVIGKFSPATAQMIQPVGDIFLRMLKMLIVPLVFFCITSGICKMGDVKQLRVVGVRYIFWVVVSAVIATSIALAAALIVQPGRGTTEFLAKNVEVKAASYSFINNVINWFPTNIVESLVKGDMLQIIVFCMFLGIALLALGKRVEKLVQLIDQGSDAILKITEFVMAFCPIGIISLMATMVSTVSGAMMKEVLLFLVVDNVVCFLVLFIVFPIAIRFFGGLSPVQFIKNIMPTIVVAIATTSSAATLPVNIKVAKENLGIRENVYGFTLPLGNTIGMCGFAIFIGLCCVFASNLYGFEITAASVIQFVFLGLILSIGAAGVKGAGIVMSTVLLESLGMPLTLIPVLAAIWPVIDPAHTVVNNAGDLAGTAIVAKRLGLMDTEVFDNNEKALG